MAKERKYVGWIYVEKEPKLQDHFFVHVTRDGLPPLVQSTGHGVRGSAAAVAFFEESEAHVYDAMVGTNSLIAGLALGKVSLEKTPLGLRVFLDEKVEKG